MCYTLVDLRHALQAFCKEVVIWKHLDHPNVLPFIGAMMVTEPGRERYEVLSEFMGNGDIRTFTRQNPDVNRLKLVGFHISSMISLNNCIPPTAKGRC